MTNKPFDILALSNGNLNIAINNRNFCTIFEIFGVRFEFDSSSCKACPGNEYIHRLCAKPCRLIRKQTKAGNKNLVAKTKEEKHSINV